MRLRTLACGTLLFVLVVAGSSAVLGQSQGPDRLSASGGPLTPELASYDVLYYDLDLRLFPEGRAIEASHRTRALVTVPTRRIVLHLDTTFVIEEVAIDDGGGSWRRTNFSHVSGRLTVRLDRTAQPGDTVRVRTVYRGQPRIAENPPWTGGFTWETTPEGAHWVAVSVQSEGADLWWPCKDHPSDEPDSMAISVEAPRPLVVASNGRLRDVEDGGSTRIYHWFVSTPINNYGVTLNAAPYETVDTTYTSVAGDRFPVTYWVLPSNLEQGRELMDQILEHLRFFEETLGPYPFRADKYGVAETPYLGMEHQTIIAYGADYQNNQFGFDFLHHHEISHEWWGNMVTAYDWKDFWLHEGFGTYAQALYAGELNGPGGYHGYMRSVRGYLNNRKPVAPRTSRTTREMYFLSSANQQSDNDIYYKGAWVLHTLRYLIGEEAFFRSLRRFAYPDSSLRSATDGRQTRFAATADYRRLVEELTGRDLEWFFEVYLRQPELPRLIRERSGERLQLEWEAPGDRPFPMPVEVSIDGSARAVPMTGGSASISVPGDANVEVDPNRWILRE